MHMFIYMWGIAKIRVSVGQSAHDLFSKRVVWESSCVPFLIKVDSNDIISTMKWAAWPKVAWFAIPAHRTLSKTLW